MTGADSFFRMGSTHRVCQDYAASGEQNGLIYAALSDGCSSSPDTDFGARFLVRGLLKVLEPIPEEQIAIRLAASMALTAGLPRTCLEATLLWSVYSGKSAHTFRAGDGVVAWRKRDGSITYDSVAFDNNAPLYLSYSLMGGSDEKYRELVSGLTIRRGYKPTGSNWDSKDTWHSLREYPDVHSWHIGHEENDLVLLFSDGVESFVNAHGDPVPLETVLDEIFAFKGFAGEFIARRCGAFLKRTCAERGWTHADDFSVAGIYLGELKP